MVQAATLVSDTFSQIFNELNREVYKLTDVRGNDIELDENNDNYWLGAYPDTELITDKGRYPIAVLDTPEVDESIIGLRLSETTLEIDITVYATRAEYPPRFVEKAVAQIRNNEDIKDSGLYNVEWVDTTKDVLTSQRGDLKIHRYTATVAMGFEVCV